MSQYNCVGLQVVKISQNPDQRYEVDEEALASVLLRPEVRDLPVVVVSVAGAYRGGKSFILDFFLRYLTAPGSSQLTGEWLGKEDELLVGFDWRGGGESNTKGIHLWPEPVIVTIERTGEKVAVLLMDTQGIFDTESDMNDNSAIFALSTLLTSVQIYNLRANIGEDDLQHLQLFTEYGRLACCEEDRAFQTLNFLIRDWLCPYEHPYGYKGGEELLKKRLQIKSNQRIQLQEVRQYIQSCFEKLQCFLMPHPGLAVIDPNFRGSLCDITEDFKTSLLELVPSLFNSENLTPKMINGYKVQAQDLLVYFKQYVKVFNSDDLPQAATIFQATVDACVIASLREARQQYENKMQGEIIEGESVSTSMMQDWHKEAVTFSVNNFRSKKKLGSQNNIEKHLKNFEQELDARLSQLLWQNENNAKNAVSFAVKTYKETIESVWKLQGCLCLHPNDLETEHHQAFQVGLFVFQQSRPRVQQEQDEKRLILIKDLKQYYQHLCSVNKQNNKRVSLEARKLYISRMKDCMRDVGVRLDELEIQHGEVLDDAIKHFHSQRNYPTEQTEDSYYNSLKQNIEMDYGDFKTTNLKNINTWAVQVAYNKYHDVFSSEWYDQRVSCLHPKALEMLHTRARELAFREFNKKEINSQTGDYKTQLIEKLETSYGEFERVNKINNVLAVEHAFEEYTRQMLLIPRIILLFPSIFVVGLPLIITIHLNSKRLSLEKFRERRCGLAFDNDDIYLQELNKKISAAFSLF